MNQSSPKNFISAGLRQLQNYFCIHSLNFNGENVPNQKARPGCLKNYFLISEERENLCDDDAGMFTGLRE